MRLRRFVLALCVVCLCVSDATAGPLMDRWRARRANHQGFFPLVAARPLQIAGGCGPFGCPVK